MFNFFNKCKCYGTEIHKYYKTTKEYETICGERRTSCCYVEVYKVCKCIKCGDIFRNMINREHFGTNVEKMIRFTKELEEKGYKEY
jgi:hypothetical protein